MARTNYAFPHTFDARKLRGGFQRLRAMTAGWDDSLAGAAFRKPERTLFMRYGRWLDDAVLARDVRRRGCLRRRELERPHTALTFLPSDGTCACWPDAN